MIFLDLPISHRSHYNLGNYIDLSVINLSDMKTLFYCSVKIPRKIWDMCISQIFPVRILGLANDDFNYQFANIRVKCYIP